MPRPGTPDPGTLPRVIMVSLGSEPAPRIRSGRTRSWPDVVAAVRGESQGRPRLRCARTWVATAAAATSPIPTGTTQGGQRLGGEDRRTKEYVRLTRVGLCRC